MKTTDPITMLVAEYQVFAAHVQETTGVAVGSADEYVHDERLADWHRNYLRDFCTRWKLALEKETRP